MKKIAFIILLFCMAGCALFRKTNKTTVKNSQSSLKQSELNQLILKRADKETQVFTYWNDSGFYQFQNIREQIDQVKLKQGKALEKQQSKQEISVKKKEPVKIWVYTALTVILCLILVVYMKLSRTYLR
ncbi:hypothetical protein D3C87_1313060 [compost metagenome]